MQEFIRRINDELICVPENNFEYLPDNREELFYLYKWLFQEALITLSSPELIRNSELTRFLNFKILTNNKALLHFLKLKHKISEKDEDKVLEKAVTLLQEDDDISFDALVSEQLLEFYKLQPQ